ncbi:hypothetical protein AHF37_09262 [Paragonimus kellicotti]|nr:hypothetical protein AHF37_09262 [Paragonimus kellicotti]
MSSLHSPSSDKENLELLQGLAEQMLEKAEFLSKPPLFASRTRTNYCLDPWHGFNEFRVWIPEPTASHSRVSGGGYQVGVMGNCPKLYVQRGRRWPLAIGFRPSLTPVDFSIRITPHFVDEDRSNDVIERCSKHAVPSADIKGRSVIEILNPGAIYLTENTLQGIPIGQISVLFPLNVIGLLEQSSERDTPEATPSSFSQSKLLAAVQCVIHCRINCFNSCFGLNLRGEVDLLITLEARERADPDSPYGVYGAQKVRVRCCACPYRDSRGLCTESELRPNVTASPCTTSNQCASRRGNFRRLSLNLPRQNTFSRTDHPSPMTPCPEVIVNGRKYKLLLVSLTYRD